MGGADVVGPQQDQAVVADRHPASGQRPDRRDDERGHGDADREDGHDPGPASVRWLARSWSWSRGRGRPRPPAERGREQRDRGEQPEAVEPLEPDGPPGVRERPPVVDDGDHHDDDEGEEPERDQPGEPGPPEQAEHHGRRARGRSAPTTDPPAGRRRRSRPPPAASRLGRPARGPGNSRAAGWRGRHRRLPAIEDGQGDRADDEQDREDEGDRERASVPSNGWTPPWVRRPGGSTSR